MMECMNTPSALAIGLLVFAIAGASRAGAAPEVTSAWVQWDADARPHARAIVTGSACPDLTVGGRVYPMELRSAPGGNFTDGVCDIAYPSGATGAHIGALPLPSVPHAPQRIVMFGDSGCRLKGAEVQACNDPQRWPFARLARAMAEQRPDLVIDVGDYYYRETACPPSTVDCTGSPYGDRTASWTADYFAPVAPLFAVAPFIHVRGNHENCKRSPRGWARYLSGLPADRCVDHELPVMIGFDNLNVAQVDSANGNGNNPDDPLFLADEEAVDAAAGSRETWLATHRPPVAFLAAHETGDGNGTHLAAIVSGHIHLFAAASFPNEEPLLIVGTGGDNLEDASAVDALHAALGATTDRRFGFAVFERSGNGWNVNVHALDGTISHRCRLENRTLRCS
jgi:hypothetical protein